MTKHRHYFSRKEWSFMILLSFLFILTTSAVYVWMQVMVPPGYVMHALSSTGMVDQLIYYQYIGQIADGSLLIYDFFTPEWPQTGVFNPFWLIVGLFARWTSISSILAYHLTRLVLIMIAVGVVYGFFRMLLRIRVQAGLATALTMFGGGVGGWFFWLLREEGAVLSGPVDLYQAESTFFASAAFRPHFIASWICMIIVVWLWVRWLEEGRAVMMFSSASISLLWFLFHPYYVPLMYLFVLLVCLWSVHNDVISWRRALWGSGSYFAVTLPALLYAMYLTFGDELLSLRNAQNITLNPAPHYILMGFGFFILCALPSVWRVVRAVRHTTVERVMVVWMLLSPLFMYAPVQFQSRFNQGWLIPLAYFTVCTLRDWGEGRVWSWLSTPRELMVVSACALLLFGSAPVYLMSKDVLLFVHEREVNPRVSVFYHEADFEVMLEYVRTQTPTDALIIAPPQLASYIPAFAIRRSGCCSEHETVAYHERRQELEQFFSDALLERGDVVQRWKPQYILDNTSNVDFSEYQLEFAVGEYRLYRVE